MKQIDVKIMQQSYLLSCPEGQEARMLEAVERVDSTMTRIRDAGKVRARDRIAVLAALNMAFEVTDLEVAMQALREEVAKAPEPAPAPAPAPEPVVIEVPAESPEDAARLQNLIARVDEALGDDGRLI